VLERALTRRDDDGNASAVLIGLALLDDDQPFVEGWCTTVTTPKIRHCTDQLLSPQDISPASSRSRRFVTRRPASSSSWQRHTDGVQIQVSRRALR
jgi:hypothetical protein